MHVNLNRRDLLQAGMVGMLGALAAQPAAGAARKTPVRSCILVYLLGGPPHLDMWDPKPVAPAEIRGPFRPIATSVPGVQFSEHLPRMARLADKLAVVRSVGFANNDHAGAAVDVTTGKPEWPTPRLRFVC